MAKKKTQKKQKNKKILPPKASVSELNESRTGGQIALRGYSYQFLYSCYLILSTVDCNTAFTLEGIEDIDKIKYDNNDSSTTHIQLKYSTVKQDASFMDSVLKNYLEVYLIDPKRDFKLVYDFSVAAGHLSKLFSSNLDSNSRKFWIDKIDSIKKENPLWKWNNYNFDDFLSKISFENVKKDSLSTSIEDTLIKTYDITTNNILLYANSLKMLCIDAMESGGGITKADIEKLIESVKFDISQGIQNPAHGFIQRVSFSTSAIYSLDYYEGKKATPSDIANNLPVERPILEREIIDSIHDNTITVIKSSSGQGKTTLALRTMFSLQNEYTPYQISSCNNTTDLVHIAEYFRMRTRIGEKPLILLDNLDAHLSEWNSLAQLLQSSVTYHYKLLITSRENDWYNFGGDISGLRSLHVIKPNLTDEEAEGIFCALKKVGMIMKK